MGSQQMVKYIGKKLISVVLMLLIVSAFTFMIIHLTPGDPARVMLGVDAPEEQVEQLREQMGLNRPLPVQYVDWLNDVLHGDLGESIFIDQPLTEIIAERMRPTIELTIFCLDHCGCDRNSDRYCVCQGQGPGNRPRNDGAIHAGRQRPEFPAGPASGPGFRGGAEVVPRPPAIRRSRRRASRAISAA